MAHPAATPLAMPMTLEENIELIQNWLATKFAIDSPTRKRKTTNPIGEEIIEVAKTIGAMRRETEAEATRGPKISQAAPIAKREKMAPETDAIPALLISVSVRLRLSRMTGRRGGVAKVEKKHEKREIHARWKARICGADAENNLNSVALRSESTAILNLGSFAPNSSMKELRSV